MAGAADEPDGIARDLEVVVHETPEHAVVHLLGREEANVGALLLGVVKVRATGQQQVHDRVRAEA